MTDASAAGDTTRATIVRGAPTEAGWRDLVPAPGEPRAAVPAVIEVLGALWHLSDLHVCDAESPARLEYLDRFSDPDSEYRDELGDVGTYRPQEALTVQVAVTMIDTVNRNRVAPVSGAAIDAVLLTGDLTDNAQRNELFWYQRIIEGGVVSPRSGDPQRSSWVGATDASTWDDRYWHPDGPPSGIEADRPTRLFGYPTIPGLVEAARADVHSPGLALPWISVHGNHDGLLQGTVAPDEALRALARGEQRIVGLPRGATPLLTREAIAEVGPARYVHDASSPRAVLASDPERDFVSDAEFARTTRGVESDVTYFRRDCHALTLLCLDTVNPHGGWQGSIDERQLDWLVSELDAARDDGRRVVIASHHPSFTLTNDYAPIGAPPRVLGSEVVATLLESRIVVAWLAGHVHFHSANRHGDEQRGFWEITTASLIDWPQQARIVEFLRVDSCCGPMIAVVSTVMDHGAPAQWAPDDLDSPANLASISRVLAANDYRLREGTLRGLLLDSAVDVRNATWLSPDPLG